MDKQGRFTSTPSNISDYRIFLEMLMKAQGRILYNTLPGAPSAGRSNRTAGHSTLQVRPSAPKRKRPNGVSDIPGTASVGRSIRTASQGQPSTPIRHNGFVVASNKMVHKILEGAPSAGRSNSTAGHSTPRVQPSASKRKKINGDSEIRPDTSGTVTPNNTKYGVCQQSSTGHKVPLRSQSCDSQNKDGEEPSGRRRYSSANLPEPPQLINSLEENYTLRLSLLGTSILPINNTARRSAGPSTPQAQSANIDPGAVGPQRLNDQESPASILGLPGRKNDRKKTPQRRPNSPVKQGQGVPNTRRCGSTHATWKANYPGNSRKQASPAVRPTISAGPSTLQDNPSTPTTAIEKGILGINIGSGTSGTQVHKIDERRIPPREPNGSADSSALPVNLSMSKSTGEHIVTNDNNIFDVIFDNVIQFCEQINKGQNLSNPDIIIIISNLFFKMLEDFAKNILEMPNNVLKEHYRNNVDIFEKVDLLTTRFESLLNTNIDATLKLNNTEREMPRNINISNQAMINDDIIMINGSGRTSNNSGAVGSSDKVEAAKGPGNKTSRQLQIKCGGNGARCDYCKGNTHNLVSERMNTLYNDLMWIAYFLKNFRPKDQRRP